MPHSVSPESSLQGSSRDADEQLPDAPVDASAHVDTNQDPGQASSTDNAPEAKVEIALEKLFNDEDDDDEEFPSSSAMDSKIESSPPPAQLPPASKSQYSDPEIMLAFYQRLFPFRQLFQWLNHGIKPSNDFGNREFAFTLQNDAYLRYQSFPTADLLRKDILRLNPSRFEIGPVYTTNPRDRKTLRKTSAFRPLAKELVFDIDLTDYDDVRTCCDKANICHKCWTFVTMAIKVVDAALREDFGFEHIMWVYSGRRGAHAWVCDKAARDMDDDKRRAIAGYMEVIRGGAQSGKKVNLKRPLHPHIVRSLEILKPYFGSSILQEQDPFLTVAQSDRLLSLLPDQKLNEALRKKWASSPDRPSASKWADIDALAKAGVSKSLDAKALMDAKQDIVLEYAYPRLDVEVSKKKNHLLKSPFVVHPGTGRVCVPIDLEGGKADTFDPLAAPTVTELLAEVDRWGGEQGPDGMGGWVEEGSTVKKISDYEKTSLKPFVEVFQKFVQGLLKDEKVIKREREDEHVDRMEF